VQRTLLGQGGNDRFFVKDSEVDQLFGGKEKDSASADSEDVLARIEVTV